MFSVTLSPPNYWTGYEIRTVQELLGHKNEQTTMILRSLGQVYTHDLNRDRKAMRSPLEDI